MDGVRRCIYDHPSAGIGGLAIAQSSHQRTAIMVGRLHDIVFDGMKRYIRRTLDQR